MRAVGRVAARRWLATAVWVGFLLLVYGAWQILRWPAGHTDVINDLMFVPVSVSAIASARAASRRCPAHASLRWAWRLVALACASYLAGDLAWMTYTLAGAEPYPSGADGFYLLFYPLMFAAMLRFPARHQTSAAAIRLGLDVAVVVIAGAVVVTYLVLGPTLLASGSDPLQTIFSVAYPVGDMVLLVGLASVVLRRCRSSLTALRFIAAGLVCFIAADLAFGYISLHSTYEPGGLLDDFWMAAMALFATGAAAQRGNYVDDQREQEIRSASWMPYLALAPAFVLLVVTERHVRLLPDLMLLLACVTLTLLVCVRQLLAQHDLARAQRTLRYQSLHDPLTSLPNRVLLLDRAQQMLLQAERNVTSVAALYVDVDDFKLINDRFGHAAGDDVLRAVGSRLSTVVRGSDTVGRLGGDEFVVLLADLTREDEADEVAERIRHVLGEPIELESQPGRDFTISASVGVAVTPSGTTDELLRDADYALYDVKRKGKRDWPGSSRR